MPSLSSLEDALTMEMMDLLSAEKQLTHALPKMAQHASDESLRKAFEQHAKETEKQVERLEKAIHAAGKSPRSHKCEAMEGILAEGKEIMSQEADPDVLDAMLIGAAQKVEHYEIASYGTLCTWAKQLGKDDVLELLKENMDEEEATDARLTKLAMSGPNKAAQKQ